VVELLAWRVHVLCSMGRRGEALAVADDALARAEESVDPVGLAAAHLATARVHGGHRREAHHEAALTSLRRSGDVVTAARALVNHSCHLLAAARYEEAATAAREALRAADIGIAAGRRASALHNLAEALVHLGAYDEATWHLDREIALCRRLGAGRIALGVLGLAEVDRHLGRDEQARAR
jgi:tetratricopeptide (TPR) repeat protein